MKYKIICIGKIKEQFYRDEVDELLKSIRRKNDEIDIIELQDANIPDKLKASSIEKFLEKECKPIYGKIEKNNFVIALCIEGKEITSDKHREIVHNAFDFGKNCITYLIGGSLGLPENVKKLADVKMSFSKMTFPHQLMRIILLEEILHL